MRWGRSEALRVCSSRRSGGMYGSGHLAVAKAEADVQQANEEREAFRKRAQDAWTEAAAVRKEMDDALSDAETARQVSEEARWELEAVRAAAMLDTTVIS